FAYALNNSVGFASLNIADAAVVRVGRSTPAIDLAQRTVDTIAKSREAECLRRGPLCRDLEAQERQALASLRTERTKLADPQIDAASKRVAWLTRGGINPAPDDLAMLRLTLLTLLPQLGGLLLMVARARCVCSRA